jgi:hypothetical protein
MRSSNKKMMKNLLKDWLIEIVHQLMKPIDIDDENLVVSYLSYST